MCRSERRRALVLVGIALALISGSRATGAAEGGAVAALAAIEARATTEAPAAGEARATSVPLAGPAFAAGRQAVLAAMAGIGREATAAEIAAWDIDVRPDFKGLPPGQGSVARGEEVWDAKCASCHGTFGESNEVFTPIVGGTTAHDMQVGLASGLLKDGGRTTLMKVSTLSTLWDYINRAMPWNAPRSLTVEEVYASLAYILNLGGVVADDFVLSNENIASVQEKLPNRDGMTRRHGLWTVDGMPDVQATACMNNCRRDVPAIRSQLPEHARDAHGDLSEQQRPLGPTRGAVTVAGQPPPPDFEETRRLARAIGAPIAAASAAAPAAVPPAAEASAAEASRRQTASGGVRWPRRPRWPRHPRPRSPRPQPRPPHRRSRHLRPPRPQALPASSRPVAVPAMRPTARRSVPRGVKSSIVTGTSPTPSGTSLVRSPPAVKGSGDRSRCRRNRRCPTPIAGRSPPGSSPAPGDCHRGKSEMSNESRRGMLQQAGGVTVMMLAAAAGLLRPGKAAAAWNKAAFEVKGNLDEVVKALGGKAAAQQSADVVMTSPDIAENGAVVPIGVASKLAKTEEIAILVEKNPNALAAVFMLTPESDASVSTRVKMGQSSDVYALVKADGKYYYAKKEVKVTLGGCGG